MIEIEYLTKHFGPIMAGLPIPLHPARTGKARPEAP